jgi:hypothetical protein
MLASSRRSVTRWSVSTRNGTGRAGRRSGLREAAPERTHPCCGRGALPSPSGDWGDVSGAFKRGMGGGMGKGPGPPGRPADIAPPLAAAASRGDGRASGGGTRRRHHSRRGGGGEGRRRPRRPPPRPRPRPRFSSGVPLVTMVTSRRCSPSPASPGNTPCRDAAASSWQRRSRRAARVQSCPFHTRANCRRSVVTGCARNSWSFSPRIRGTLLARPRVEINRCDWICRVY